ncbi:porin family protein [Flavihumibacter solisilvae]|uniref:porin family protein n=1 Tax=Flavihumibacter solisilvae TaxID=1349421 RepID=UPI00068A4B30|nr:porin family protein [Flavihumibacter solisilvae]
MKKSLMVLIALVVTGAIYAQSPVHFGVRAGLNFASIKGDAATQLDQVLEWTDGMLTTGGRTGFHAGGFMQIPLGSRVMIEPGLSYSTKGYGFKGKVNLKVLEVIGINATTDLRTQYLEMPVLVKARIGKGFEVFAGPQVSYLLSSDLRVKAGVLGVNLLNRKWNVTDQFNRWDAAITGGIGYQFNNGLNIYAGYDHGLSRLNAGQSVDAYNRNIRVGMAMRF